MALKNIKLAAAGTLSALVLALSSLGIAAAVQPIVECPEGSHQQGQNCKVTICHRTDSATNPYNKEDVDVDSVGGGKDEGQGDHTTHTGPVATSQTQAQSLKDNKEKWGDIIPPFGEFPGMNWTPQGQAIFNNDCNFVTGGQGGGGGGGGGGGTTTTTTTPTTTTTGGQGAGQQVATTPSGAVNAGVGSAKSISAGGVAGVLGSVASLVSGLLWSLRRKAF